ncbi:GNAT family N-acetyltransferase [Paenibacillus psychroresistens]|uniref:GNAT family N-acetyltransferase n=1 Tax=Paenibacillus psychroresistens TaxID=1778678 RepID=A0A6B8RJR4_9BACL|nr:GNAT family N-acetyltransferase [Paenibacillus psychroresistens]QGQ96067.1 GNAT family N-acetyltransferase [Paenibacillus psychroresistens]
MTIKQLVSEEEWTLAFPVMKELRMHLTLQSFIETVNQMTNEGYKLFAIYENNEIVGLSGIIFRTNFYYGKHVFVYDLVTTSSVRSKGYGTKLLNYVHQLSKEQDCKVVALESAFSNINAHKFYQMQMGYEKFCYSFKKIL